MVPDSGDFKLISRKAIDHIEKFNEINPFFSDFWLIMWDLKENKFFMREKRD